ncbi:TIGR01458 family HAD-type hydrolase [Methylophaga sp.]|jgi:HAD superfamily hydrolase (TIGR01458 family)|uniref:TIGR01458 family HAD-type hydrolase n=1 Tax=Methylophaga sp. TaxID=2024840 RepID=UPI00140117C2|nr:TIGR01458 family HAD-type hydrolase [Methylophaga sp.]MTI62446.1 TIGR01458 family HAD-type hydrolase [Methylophaga sp.]
MLKAILFDISGVLHVDKRPIPGAVETVAKLQQNGVPMRFVTNTSRSTSQDIFNSLRQMGFEVRQEDIFTAPVAVKTVCQQRGLRPYLLIHPDLEAEFSDINQQDPNAVVLADAANRFDYAHLNKAFALLISGAPLLGIGRNRYFKSGGQLQLDAGPFIDALEYAADTKAEILGKPAAGFFHAAVSSLGCKPEEVLMIGDDVEADVIGAREAGLEACLVRTGKYLPGDENKAGLAAVADSVVEAVRDVFYRHREAAET